MKRTCVLAGVAVLTAAAMVRAQGAPKPSPELAQGKFFEGNWACQGNSPAGPFGPAHKTQSAMQVKLDLDGFWYIGTVREAKTAENAHPLRGMFHEGYDGAAKQFIVLWVDSFGNWSTETTSGWQGDTRVYTGDQFMSGEKTPARDTFVKKSDTEFSHKFELNLKGQWTEILNETCKKASSAKM